MAIPKNDWYTIQSGDTLSKIANEAGISDWKTIYNDPQNEQFRKDRPDPNKIYPGDKIWIPGNPKTSTGKKTVFVAPSVLQASIVQIEVESNIAVAYAKKKVIKPHWKEGESVDDAYTEGGVSIDCSKKPAVFSVKEKTARLKVKLNISKLTVSGDCKLTGTLEGLKFEATFKGEVGEKEVVAEAITCPITQNWYKGDMQWELYPEYYPSKKISLTPTRMELFFILDKPSKLYQTNGVWTEVLRFLFQKAGVGGTNSEVMAAAKITEYVHSRHGLEYNTGEKPTPKGPGSAIYTELSIGSVNLFRLTKYINKTLGKIVNCFDQASAVQALCSAIGISIQWLFCKPFGFINTTYLVGVGMCNNPFYPVSGGKKIEKNDSNREPFGCHAFCGIGINKQDNVLDGCAGPHLGNENWKKYLDVSIDRSLGGDGNVNDINKFNPISSIE